MLYAPETLFDVFKYDGVLDGILGLDILILAGFAVGVALGLGKDIRKGC